MTDLAFSNNASSTLAGTITATAVTWALASGTGALFPTLAAGQGFYGSFTDALTGTIQEIVLVTGMSGDTITAAVRGQDNTSSRGWTAGDIFELRVTAADLLSFGQKAAIQNGVYNYAAATGSANVYAVTLTPIPNLIQGSIVRATIATANTGAATLAVNGGSAYPIYGGAGTALQGGEIAAGSYCEFEYSPTLGSGNTPAFSLIASAGGSPQVPTATGSKQAVPLAQAQVLHGMLTFTSSSSFVATQTAYFVDSCAAGGGGGGGHSGTSATGSGGGGGGAGQSVIRNKITTVIGETLTITIGVAGAAGASGATGGTGGNLTIVGSTSGTLVSLTGGTGGGGGINVTGSSGGAAGGAGYPKGSDGSDSVSGGYGGANGGAGGSSPFGGGGPAGRGGQSTGLVGGPAGGYGGGGGGGGGYYNSGTGTGVVGGAGTQSFAFFQW